MCNTSPGVRTAWPLRLVCSSVALRVFVLQFSVRGVQLRLDQRLVIPNGSLIEFLLFAVLAPSLDVDLQQLWQKSVVASDASPFFGFGVSFTDADPNLARDI